MKPRSLPLLILPILGILFALLFRPLERNWETLEKPLKVQILKRTLALPDGQGLRFIAVPNSNVHLSETEVPQRILDLYEGETASHQGALRFARWISEVTGETIRLPSTKEWSFAARRGIPNAEFVWGFGPPTPPKGLHFALSSPPRKPGPTFGYGFRDMAGGLWEWTEEGLLLGSAWSERDPQTLYIDHHFDPPDGYAGLDTGIRLLWEKE